MPTLKLKTNLNCSSCVSAVTPILNTTPSVKSWAVDTSTPDKVLTVEGESVTAEVVKQAVESAGFKVLGEIAETPKATYFPLIVIVGYLLAAVAVFEISAGAWDTMRAMRHFMAGFFIVFSFFKMLDVPAFADTFAMYDLIAARSRAYSLAYPYIELTLGLMYLANWLPRLTNWATLILMSVGAIGVIRQLLRKSAIRCACLGTVFQLPMSTVTLIEDAGMAAMAAVMLLM